ncbi:hypothetical protein F511_15089 [Dorcoceras hygrometricum]|uniref:Uncharacterized protein n=1 Tax=Dorcoceras hygrometricum TaxID=472368 RepID=A0A2Z7BRU2_9LAMI|nr:hypothetical protein F511_15089 [Dorcoceras hygrometricum]
MAIRKSPYCYTKIGHEDPEEAQHRLAQFLIYKTLKKADTKRSWLGVRIVRLRIKIGTMLKKMRRVLVSTVFSAKSGLCKQVYCALKSWKRLLRAKRGTAVGSIIPPTPII